MPAQQNNQQPLPSLDDQLNFIRGAINIVESNPKKNQIIIDNDNAGMLKAIEESLSEVKLQE
jgi:hypothetical protein